MAKQMKNTQRAQILTFLNMGLTTREVALKFSISHSTVVRVRQKLFKYNTYEHIKGNGRPTVINNTIMDLILKENSKNKKIS
ncbi:hypothetical protein H311_00763, partial [Anncaliia algerae PRA109]